MESWKEHFMISMSCLLASSSWTQHLLPKTNRHQLISDQRQPTPVRGGRCDKRPAHPPRPGGNANDLLVWMFVGWGTLHLKQSPKKLEEKALHHQGTLQQYLVDFFSCTVIRCLWWSPGTVCFFFVRFCPELVAFHFWPKHIPKYRKTIWLWHLDQKNCAKVLLSLRPNSLVPVPWSISLRMSKRHDTLREALKKTWAVYRVDQTSTGRTLKEIRTYLRKALYVSEKGIEYTLED